MLSYGGIPFEDSIVTREDWPQLKPKQPFGQVPVLEVDGQQLAQSSAIERYAAKLAGLYPDDPWQAAKVDELVAFFQEINDLFVPTHSIKDEAARRTAREEVSAGPLKTKLDKLSQLLGDKEFFLGSQPLYPDFLVYHGLSFLSCGWLDGIPTDLLQAYPVLKAHHNRVASLPAVAQRYADVTEGPRLAYKVLQ